MGILSKADKNRLLVIEGLRKFVMDKEQQKYIKKVREWKSQIPKTSDLAEPEMLAGSLTNYLKMYDDTLGSRLWGLFKSDESRIEEFYDIIGKYFVDLEAAEP